MLATDWNVTRRALLARVNRKLAHSHEAVRKYRRNQRPWERRGAQCPYYRMNLMRNEFNGDLADGEFVDLAREIGVLHSREIVVD